MNARLQALLKKGYDPEVREELLSRVQKRVNSGHVLPIAPEDVDKSFPPQRVSTGKRVGVADLNRLFSKI
jgi:hypothetical protein